MSAPLSHAASKSVSFCRYRYIKNIQSKCSAITICSNHMSKPNVSTIIITPSRGIYHFCSPEQRVNKLKVANVTGVGRDTEVLKRKFSTEETSYILGIETSCDDTGAAVIDSSGNVLGEALDSQTSIHVEMGGIIPTIARDLHRKNIVQVVQDAMNKAEMCFQDIDGIAVTTEPGLAMSLNIGLHHAKYLAREYRKPLLPIHHMEAHALTVRMIEHVEFPYLVLLVSGGHCLLAVAEDVDKFLLLGRGIDDSPGDAFDKTARQMKLKNLSDCAELSGGAAVELLAKNGDPKSYNFPAILSRYRDCNFSFAGLKDHTKRLIKAEEIKQGIFGGNVLSNAADICASFQEGVLIHLSHRIRRGFLYTELKGLLPDKNKTLVISGGVASNLYIRQGLENVCQYFNCRLVCPPPKLCTDNGLMIAWNGIERFKRGIGIVPVESIENVDFKPRSPLGRDVTQDVIMANIKVSRRY